jgi:SAM-dependent methyltransferase
MPASPGQIWFTIAKGQRKASPRESSVLARAWLSAERVSESKQPLSETLSARVLRKQGTMNPNTPGNWNQRWKALRLIQKGDPWVQARLKTVASLLLPQTTVLDVASGPSLIRPFLPRGITYLAQDFSFEAFTLSGEKGICSDARAIPLRDKSIHTVLALEILEHLDEERPLIQECIRVATHQIIFSVPDHRLSEKQFSYHRRTYTEGELLALLGPVRSWFSPQIFHSPGSLIARCLLK